MFASSLPWKSFTKARRSLSRAAQVDETFLLRDPNCCRSQDETDVAVSFIAALKDCAKRKDLQHGRKLHTDIAQIGLLENNVFIGNTLITMYAKCGALEKAQEVFDELPLQNTVSWNALIAGYALHRHGQKALDGFERMQLEGFSPNAVTFACSLKACGNIGASHKGQEIHAQIVRERFLEKHIVVANALVDMYVKFGALKKAQEAFDELRFQSVVSWTALIAGYAQHGQYEEALYCFEQMQLGGFSPDTVTFACILKACGSLGDLDKGQDIHTQVVREHLLEKQIGVSNALLDMYAKCGAPEKAQEVFDKLSIRNVVSWTALISGYAEQGLGEEALICYEQMQLAGYCPDAVTFACVLKACGNIKALSKGQEIHARIMRDCLLENHTEVANAILGMYAKCGALQKAQEVFRELPVRDVVSWNALIAGYVQHAHDEEALNCFEEMQVGGISPSKVTFSCILKACGNIGALEKGQELHAQVVREYLLGEHVVIANALVDMYCKCGALEKAQEMFDELPVRDIVMWTALITGYAEHEHGDEALNCFERMQLEGFFPDAITFACILKACGSVGAAYKGQNVHFDLVRHGVLEKDLVVGIALIAMYANCCMLEEAQHLFNKLPVRDVVSWSALMVGYAQLGRDEIVFNLFDRMIGEGIQPDLVIFTIVLSTCSHRSLLDAGQVYFEILSNGYGIVPTLEHHTCMVDLLGRAGYLDKAAAFIKEIPLSANVELWHTLLGACRKWVDMKLGRWAFEHALQLNESQSVSSV